MPRRDGPGGGNVLRLLGSDHPRLHGSASRRVRRDLRAQRSHRRARRRAPDHAAGTGGFPQSRRSAVCATAVHPIRQRVVGGGLAAAVSDPALGAQPESCAHDPGLVLAFSPDRPARRSRDLAAGEARAAADRQRAFRHLRLFAAFLDQQCLRRGHGRVLGRRRFCQHLPAGGGSDRAALSVLSSRLLQRHLFLCADRRIGRARDSRLCGGLLRSRCGHRDPSDWNLHGDGDALLNLAGIESDRKMKRATFPALLALALVPAPASAATLAESIERLLASSPASRTAFWGIQAVDLATGRTVYELNANHFFVPASNTKLFTTALALMRLGPEFTFQTRVMADAPPDSAGRIAGELRLVGGGDPNLSARAIPYRMGPVTGNPLAAIEELANQVAARGVKRVAGDVVGDDTWYLWQPYAPGWGIHDPESDDGPPISALTINDNAFRLQVRPGAREGDLAVLELNPPIEFHRIDNRVRTVAAGGERRIRYDRLPGSFDLRLWGTIPRRDPGQSLTMAMEDPALYAARSLRDALTARGIAVEGEAVARHLFPNEVDDATQAGEPVAAPGAEL